MVAPGAGLSMLSTLADYVIALGTPQNSKILLKNKTRNTIYFGLK
jgi:hypothetical protein